MVDKGVINITDEEALKKMELEYFECGKCAFHIAIDSTYLLQIGRIKMKCPACGIKWVFEGCNGGEEDD